MSISSEIFDVCVVGAGVAGGTLAAYLGKQGVKVCVVEKSFAEQERIVGELLQPGGVIKLKEMGLERLLDGFDAQPVFGYALFLNGDSFPVAYPTEDGKQLNGFGFRNHKFISSIRNYLQSLASVKLIEGTVSELIEDDHRIAGVRYNTKQSEGNEIKAKLTVVCDGMFSQFRQFLSENEKKVSSFFMGMVLKHCELPYPNHGHVIVAQPSPCLVYPITATETRILIDFPQAEAPRKSQELTDYLHHIIAPQLPKSVQPSFKAAVDEGKFKVMPNHYIPAKPIFKPGVAMIGDSLNMRHPLTGGGMTAAFTDIKLLGDLLSGCEIRNSKSVDAVIERFYKTRHKQNATINILADALYGVMRNEDLKIACYEYLKRGGVYAQEPVSLLSAISRDQQLLLRHFFAVALYGMKNLPNVRRIRRSQRMLHDAVDIVSPLVLNEKPGLLTKYVFKSAKAIF